MTIKLSKANAIIRGALKKGGELDLKPLTVVVLDAGGHMVAMQRSDGAAILRPQIAGGKAFGALAMGMGSASLEAAFKERPHFGAGLEADALGHRDRWVAAESWVLFRPRAPEEDGAARRAVRGGSEAGEEHGACEAGSDAPGHRRHALA